MTPPFSASLAIVPAAATTVLVAGLLAGPAQAGEYDVTYCRDSGGQPLVQNPPRPLFDWVARSDNGPPGGYLYERCSAGGDPFTTDWIGANNITVGDTSEWVLDPAEGLSFAGWRAHVTGHVASTYAHVALNHSARIGSEVPIIESAAGFDLCGDSNTIAGALPDCSSMSYRVRFLRPPAQLTFAMTCKGPPPNQPEATCQGGGVARMDTSVVSFRDSTPPTAITVRGPLLSSAPGNPVGGTQPVSVDATDVGSGVKRIEVVVDGVRVGASGDQCTPPFDRMTPCPVRAGAEVAFDTRLVADGTHQLKITAIDASDERGVLWSGPLIVSNGAPVGPGGDPNLRGPSVGSYGGDDAMLDAWWPGTGRAPSQKKAVRKRCKTKGYARRHVVACKGRQPSRSLSVRWSSRKQNLIRGRLVTPAGGAIGGARLQLLATPATHGGSPQLVAELTTAADGRFFAAVPASSGSATYTIRWMARARDTQPAAAVELRRTVRANTTFDIDRRTVRRGRILTLTGRLNSRNGVIAGNAIAIQARPQKTWRAVKTVRTGDDGRWVARYRVPAQLRGRYRFRAVVVPSASYPYASAPSSIRTVVVR
jgi:hypothetical protein